MSKPVQRLRDDSWTCLKTTSVVRPMPPIKPLRLIGRLALMLFLALCWTGVAKAQLAPVKEIRITNNTNETLYAVLQIGRRSTDEWMQAFFAVLPPEIGTRRWPSDKVYRVYINGLSGIPAGGTAVVAVPFLTYLTAADLAKRGVQPDLLIDWWNGGRVSIYDQFGSSAYRKDYSKDLATRGNPIVPPKFSGNRVVTCKAGDCRQLKIFAGAAVLPGNDPDQLTEYTFGDAITAQGAPYPFEPRTVGYNISSVDQLYLPLAMQPSGNRLIPYIGSVESLTQFRATLARWLNNNPGWPLYKGFDIAHPRIPEAHTIFLDGYLANGAYNAKGPLTRPGKAVQDMVALYKTCTGAKPPGNYTCIRLQAVSALFRQNYRDYTKLACADKKFVNTNVEALRRIYGWVPYNTGCPSGANALINTTGIDGNPKKFNAIQTKYIDLQYNYRLVTKSSFFNPYVELVHSKAYLNMAAYAFSIDDAIGFQHYRGNGLLYAIGGPRGLANKLPLEKDKLVNVAYGHPPNTTLWKSIGICSNKADSQNLDPKFPSLDFLPPQYPCLISALNVDGKTYQFRLTKGPPDLKLDCAGVLQPEWCKKTNILLPNKVIASSTR